MPPSSSFSWNVLGNKVAMGVMVVGAVAWLCYCSFQDLSESIKNGEKKDSKKIKQPQKNDDRKGISPDDLEAALEKNKRWTKEGDCISCREAPSTPKKKTTKIPVPKGTPEALPGLESAFNTVKDGDTSVGSTSSTKSEWDKLVPLPSTPKKKVARGDIVPPTPSNSLTIMLKNKKKKEPTSEGATISSSSDLKSDDMEKTQDDL